MTTSRRIEVGKLVLGTLLRRFKLRAASAKEVPSASVRGAASRWVLRSA